MAELEREFSQELGKGIDGRISAANGRLRAANMRTHLERIGRKLYLRATLPPKPDSQKLNPFQQRIPLKIAANPAGISLAEKEARKVSALLDCGEFSWEPYLTTRGDSPQTVGDWVDRFAAEYRDQVEAITWRSDYEKVFRRLPMDEPLSEPLLKRVLLATKSNTRTRRRFSLTLTKLAQFAGLESDFKPLQGTYSASQVEPRDLPDDRTIMECFHQIKNDGWQWVYGMIATFGLRGHEVFYLDIEDLERGGHMVSVLEGKTGKRLVWACYPEWVDQFNLRQKKLPPVTGKEHCDFTNRVCKFFGRAIPFDALDLRHRWAVRTLEFGLPYELAAKQMGHSVTVHERTYHRWITADTHQRAFDALMLRGDRPLPPSVLRS